VTRRATTSIFISVLLAFIVVTGCGDCTSEPAKPTPTATAGEPTPTQTQNGGPAELPDNHQYSINFSDQNNLVITVDVWVKGAKLRSDYAITPPGEDTDTTIFINDGEFDWVYDPDDNKAVKYNPGAGMNPAAFYSMWFSSNYYGAATESEVMSAMQASCSIDPLCQSVKISGHDTVAGQNCAVFTMTSTEGAVFDLYVSSIGCLLKLTLTDYGFVSTIEFKDIDLNPSISDDIFDIDTVAPGAEITDNT
jgi:outer membrane lipoprotein-sorting protein